MLRIIDNPLPYYDTRRHTISLIVLHSVSFQTLKESLDSFETYKVSSHYLIDRDGTVYRLVPEDKKAYHAGISNWRRMTSGAKPSLNDCSIGIEFQRLPLPHAQLTQKQIKAGIELCAQLMRKYKLKTNQIVGHADIAPNRKDDPVNFPWRTFGKARIGVWTDKMSPGPHSILLKKTVSELLESIGYPVQFGIDSALIAFKRHYMPNARPDAHITQKVMNRLASVVEEYQKIAKRSTKKRR